MRRSIGLLAMVLASAVVAAACSPRSEARIDETTTTATDVTTTTSETPTTTTTPGPKLPYGGQAIVADDHEPPTLNPFIPGGDDPVVSRIGQAYLAGVQEISGFTLELIPELVTELPTVGNGGVVVNENGTMTVNYQIRDEAVWSDGVPISGDDFQFTLDTITNPDLPIVRRTYEDIVASEYTDKSFTYTLALPTVDYELIFDTILPRHAVEGSDFVADWNITMWPSSGPFVLSEWARGESLRVERNDNYWKLDAETGQQLPYLDEVTFRFIPETESIINAFRSREVDVVQPPPAAETIEVLQALESEGARVEVLPGRVWEHLNWQFGPGRLDRNPNSCGESLAMRRAVARTIDRSVLTDVILAGQVAPLDSYVSAYRPLLSNDNWSVYETDPDLAAQLYAEAKDELGKECAVVFSTTSNNDARVKMAELFVGMFEASGIPYENQLEDGQVFFGETIDTGFWDLGEWAWQGSPGLAGLVTAHDLFDPEAPPPDGSNYYRWGSADSSVIDEASVRFAEIRDAVNATVDEDELRALFAESEAILASNLVILPLYARPVVAAVWEDEIGGFKHNPTRAADTWNIEDWYRTDLDS